MSEQFPPKNKPNNLELLNFSKLKIPLIAAVLAFLPGFTQSAQALEVLKLGSHITAGDPVQGEPRVGAPTFTDANGVLRYLNSPTANGGPFASAAKVSECIVTANHAATIPLQNGEGDRSLLALQFFDGLKPGTELRELYHFLNVPGTDALLVVSKDSVKARACQEYLQSRLEHAPKNIQEIWQNVRTVTFTTMRNPNPDTNKGEPFLKQPFSFEGSIVPNIDSRPFDFEDEGTLVVLTPPNSNVPGTSGSIVKIGVEMMGNHSGRVNLERAQKALKNTTSPEQKEAIQKIIDHIEAGGSVAVVTVWSNSVIHFFVEGIADILEKTSLPQKKQR